MLSSVLLCKTGPLMILAGGRSLTYFSHTIFKYAIETRNTSITFSTRDSILMTILQRTKCTLPFASAIQSTCFLANGKDPRCVLSYNANSMSKPRLSAPLIPQDWLDQKHQKSRRVCALGGYAVEQKSIVPGMESPSWESG